ncbi:hypothetical protein C8R42DRAFT_166963 [Lentinula raphanica]|nr:hypothetical protein C8R42DRAFT_166963 [Lentinula raphanica]
MTFMYSYLCLSACLFSPHVCSSGSISLNYLSDIDAIHPTTFSNDQLDIDRSFAGVSSSILHTELSHYSPWRRIV